VDVEPRDHLGIDHHTSFHLLIAPSEQRWDIIGTTSPSRLVAVYTRPMHAPGVNLEIAKKVPGAADSRLDRLLAVTRFAGLIGFLGGLAALAALTWFGPQPQSVEQWRIMIPVVRAIFYPCTFGGIVILLIVGGTIWWRRRRALNPQPWFRLMMALIVVAVPILHIWARWSMLKMVDAVEAGELDRAAMLWTRLSWAFLMALVAFLGIATIGILKPRMGR
jgi:hypothetical protein